MGHRTVLILVTFSSGILCALVTAGTIDGWDGRVMSLATTAVTVAMAALGWIAWLLAGDLLGLRAEYRRREAVLIRTAGRLAEARPTAPSVPFPRAP